uniref:mitogen-activated protein kinase kinase n=1 Tax=Haptolina brevifila TaxID=156173 RepID=A0A7S2IUP2_9EUKA|mmetsp:Transcript_7196/g.14705  ORF Transcript_7196/g.14705 Transcript_7196/m.14705 type:complete len:366 (+) Transcript_7196:46-1143(+)
MLGQLRINDGIESGDEEDDAVGSLKLDGAAPLKQNKGTLNDQSFMLSDSGTFKVEDFNISKSGLVPSGERGVSNEAPAREVDVTTISDLETLDKLGSGASGTVYRAKHIKTGEVFAVKQVRILDKPKRDQVVSELRIMMSHTQCPWLVSLYNAFYEEANVYTVLEFMDAGSVADLVEKHKDSGLMDERELAKISLQLLNGLNYLHRQLHQVHRDLKPANVLLNRRGQVKISDFGISSQLESTAGLCSTFVGTTCYMSPERLSGTHYSYAADVWSFGIIILELAKGAYPYPQADSYFKLLEQIMDSPAPVLPEGDFSDHFAEFVSICLDKEPNLRPAAHDIISHPFLRQYPMDDMLLSGMMEGMTL